nr:hypothetical protein [Tanacetum cinerariifolium]
MVSEPGFETVGSKDLTCEDWMVNTRTDADLSAAVQNALQTLLPQIRAEIREEFCTSSGPMFLKTTTFLPLRHVYYLFYLCYSLSLYPFTERYAQPYFFLCLIRQALLPQIHAEIREEFRTSSGPSDAGGNPPPRFLRLAGFLGAAAGTEEEQAKNFQ